MKVQLSEEDENFLWSNGSILVLDGEEWYYIPHWYKKVGKGLFEIVEFEKLPEHVVDFLKKQRDGVQ